ncbi:hypothetical protein GI584_04005 [Gracilibacillus salitolerans]|uniref:Uncharacterized protein n=1 Tax=Gracilibacillus salitolerans TaxID=2663022 RepID=A0A5Q2TGQ2_9BACI|nr:hypothetical protein [Gracilibacillus salitolerans]QGH33252.1 hypothetical protein GI584_04005 [Gracilibacillus salitolerans]
MKKWAKWIGISLFLIAIAFSVLQIGSLIVQSRYQAEYIDNRLFYVFNMIIAISLAISLLLLLSFKKIANSILVAIAILIITVNGYLMYQSNQTIENITSISPDTKQIFSLKKNTDTNEAIYYRSYYRILARPKEALPNPIAKEGEIKWLADDIAVFTYGDNQEHIQQFVGTYGDRNESSSYSYVGAQIHGQWDGENTRVTASSEGITIVHQDDRHVFEWEQVHQYGTLAIVLEENNGAAWTIALGDDFYFDQNTTDPPTGEILLYRATLADNEAIPLKYQGEAHSMIE